VAHRRGSLFTVLTIDLWRGFDLLRRGDLEQAQESIEAGLEEMVLWSGLGGRHGDRVADRLPRRNPHERGDLDAAEKVLERGHPAERTGDGPNFWRKSKIELLLARGRAEEALALCDVYEAKLGTMKNPRAGALAQPAGGGAGPPRPRRGGDRAGRRGGRGGARLGQPAGGRPRPARARRARARGRDRASARGGRDPGALDRPPRARQGAARPQHRPALGASADRCPRAPAPRPRHRWRLQRRRPRRARPRRAPRGRRPPPPRGPWRH
jgi:hypothetical protein